MQYRMKFAVMALAALLTACGDGDGPRTSAVRVAGDSLNDGGTFGFKFTVQDEIKGNRIWLDHVAEAVGQDAPCPRYRATSADSVEPNPDPAYAHCTSHGVVRARINVPPDMAAGDASPFSIPQQLKDLASTSAYGPEELLLLDGGGNDLADLMRAFLVFGEETKAVQLSETSYFKLLAELGVVPAGVDESSLAEAGGLYMGALANVLADQIVEQALNNGAQRVALLNMPDLTRTPYFRLMLAKVEEKSGTEAAAQVEVMALGWMQAFNSGLQAGFAGEPRVAVVDFHSALRRWATPAVVAGLPNLYGFTNTTNPACPSVGVDTMGLPTYFLGSCLGSALSASPPAGAGQNWWQTYVFSDDFHGSPMTNRLMADLVVNQLRERGWL
jgi:outer membrane lipase/esterase